MLKIVCVVFCSLIFAVFAQQNAGDKCAIQAKNNAPGVCKILKDCPEALDDLRNKVFPQICGFQGTVPVVCCKQNVPPRQNLQPVRKPGELSFEKCRKYSEITLFEVDIPTFEISETTSVNETTCTHEVSTLVIGGVDADPKEFPHMALLGYQNNPSSPKKWLCGGTLISERFVLTAAHCLTSPSDGQVRFIRLGDLNIYSDSDDAQPEEFNVIERIKHPEYKLPSKYNDIMLLKLDHLVVFSQYMRPACLYTGAKKLKELQRFIATGWGLTQVGASIGSSHLQKVILDSFSHFECNSSYESNINRKLKDGIRPESQLCAGGKTEEKDTCQGDSGGPLQIYSTFNCMYDIVGVTSFGKSCGLVSVPGVYTKVINYLDWIEKTVWP